MDRACRFSARQIRSVTYRPPPSLPDSQRFLSNRKSRCRLGSNKVQELPTLNWNGKLASTWAVASAGDPDAYSLSYDSDDSDEEFQHTAEPEASFSAGREELPSTLGFFGKLRHGLHVALQTVATAPRESWQSVAVTAGAATSLILDPGARTEPGSSEVSEEEMDEAGGGSGGQSGPVGRARVRWKEAQNEMPEGAWGKIQWAWDLPPVKKLRITITAAQWSFRLPAILALLATQGGLLASQVSLPLLAPLLLGTGMMLRGIRSNASIIVPRICVLVVLLYVLWFINSVVQNTAVYLRRQGAVDARVSGAIITASECCALLAALVIVLSMIGVNVSGLLLPAGIALAYASKDLSHNFLAGFFLFAAQPFKLGDRISVSYSTAAAASAASRSAWFEGTCEKVDLRYTVVKSGPRRLFVPNSAFLTREFVVMDDADSPQSSSKRDLFPPELAGGPQSEAELEQQAAYGPPPPAQGWSQPQPVWVRAPPYGNGVQQPPHEVSQPAAGGPPPPPAAATAPFRQWSGTGWHYTAAGEQQQASQQNGKGQPGEHHHVDRSARSKGMAESRQAAAGTATVSPSPVSNRSG